LIRKIKNKPPSPLKGELKPRVKTTAENNAIYMNNSMEKPL